MTDQDYPLQSLREGQWFKLICGASFQHLPSVRHLTLAYTLAGADCIDVAADPAVVLAAKEAIKVAVDLSRKGNLKGFPATASPWLMVSLNDGEDPHFRKAEFDAAKCPAECPRPCELICPANAIVFQPAFEPQPFPEKRREPPFSGVISDRCYGCGRCLPICPIQHISASSYVSTPQTIAPLFLEMGIDAVEIHTQIGRLEHFQRLWSAIRPWANRLKLVAISCPDGEGLIDYLWSIYRILTPLACALIWQTDGRSMSGDIGTGTTRAAIKLGQKVLAAGLPGYVQLAGGTNGHTVSKLRSLGLLRPNPSQEPDQKNSNQQVPLFPADHAYISGVAYGSYARTLLLPILEQLETLDDHLSAQPSLTASLPALTKNWVAGASPQTTPSMSPANPILPAQLENFPDLLEQAVNHAHSLVSQLKPPSCKQYPPSIMFMSEQQIRPTLPPNVH